MSKAKTKSFMRDDKTIKMVHNNELRLVAQSQKLGGQQRIAHNCATEWQKKLNSNPFVYTRVYSAIMSGNECPATITEGFFCHA